MSNVEAVAKIPFVFDLDGTFVSANTLHENFVDALFHAPGRLLSHIPEMFGDRAALKETLARVKSLDPAALPYRPEILKSAMKARAEGRKIYLVTAADQSIADSVAEHLGVFDGAKGSDGRTNLKGKHKLAWLRETFPQGFVYAGDSAADLPIWEEARRAVLVGSGVRYADRLREADVEVETIGPETHSLRDDWLTEFRLHQWSKNLLIFAPLFLGHIAGDPQAVFRAILAFVIFGLVASGTYLINDLVDLRADRAHATKKFRPIAAGRIGVVQGLAVGLTMIALGIGASFALRPAFALFVFVYLALTLAYSFRFKRYPMLDVAIIGALFTLRVVMGTSLDDRLVYSPWLNSFAACFFFSLALAKRHVELVRARARGADKLSGRGYRADDWPLTLGHGIAAATVSIVIMLLYVALDAGAGYARPAWLYAAPVGVFLWTQRIWLLSHRGELHDDPIVFALKDKVSYLIGALVATGFLLAT